SLLVMLRTSAISCARSASRGRCSLSVMPGTRVLRALNEPPVGLPGLGSKVSMWLGPPLSHKRMQAPAGRAGLAANARGGAEARETIAPKMELIPARRRSRRANGGASEAGEAGGRSERRSIVGSPRLNG